MDVETLHALGLTNLTEKQVKALTSADDIARAKQLSELSPKALHMFSLEEQKDLQRQVIKLKSANSTLLQKNKNARLSGGLSATAIAIGGGLISTGNPTDETMLGIGWGLLILGTGIMLLNSLFG